jgi:hypothetical protein
MYWSSRFCVLIPYVVRKITAVRNGYQGFLQSVAAKTMEVRTSYHARDADVSSFPEKAGCRALSAKLEDVLRAFQHTLQERVHGGQLVGVILDKVLCEIRRVEGLASGAPLFTVWHESKVHPCAAPVGTGSGLERGICPVEHTYQGCVTLAARSRSLLDGGTVRWQRDASLG